VSTQPVTTPVTTPPVTTPPPFSPPQVTPPPLAPTATGTITQINQDVGGLGLPQPLPTDPSLTDVAVAAKASILIGTAPAPLP
jgi:hypothetical protein